MDDNAEKNQKDALIRQFCFERTLKQDQAGRRIALLGSVQGKSTVLVLERAAFPTAEDEILSTLSSITHVRQLGCNDVYHWFLAEIDRKSPPELEITAGQTMFSDLKVNLFYPATEKHIRKYSAQRLHVVHETPEIYRKYVRPFIERCRTPARLQWMRNILNGDAEADDVIYRSHEIQHLDGNLRTNAFVLLPDLNWDRTTTESLHILAIVERDDIWSLRDLKKKHIPWLWRMRSTIIEAIRTRLASIQGDELKFYVHYMPTYFQFHVHIVHVALESGATQATGKAIGYESIIAQLESMAENNEDNGMDSISMTYTIGEADEIWTSVWQQITY